MSEISGEARRGLIEAAGLLFEQFGLARSRGIVWGLVYFSPKPLSLDEMVKALGISKGSASTAARDLVSLGAIRQVWIEGDRRDYFEAMPEAASFVRNLYASILKPQFAAFEKALLRTDGALRTDEKKGALTREEAEVCRGRLRELQAIERKLAKIGPTIAKAMDSL